MSLTNASNTSRASSIAVRSKGMRKGEEGCRAAFRRHAADGLDACGRCISRKGAHAIKRKMIEGDITDAERPNGIQPMQGYD